MATDRQIAANRLNALSSTGPRTDDGKSNSRRNALQHGLTARRMLLDGEDANFFEEGVQALYREFQPVGPVEEELVENLAETNWRLRRIPAFEAALFDYSGHQVLSLGGRGGSKEGGPRKTLRGVLLNVMIPGDVFAKLSRYEAHLVRQVDRIVDQLRKLQTERRAVPAA
jgi:hypothetical protein